VTGEAEARGEALPRLAERREAERDGRSFPLSLAGVGGAECERELLGDLETELGRDVEDLLRQADAGSDRDAAAEVRVSAA